MVNVRPSDKDAQARCNECKKVVRRIAFERAIATDETQKSVADQINLDVMGNRAFTIFGQYVLTERVKFIMSGLRA